MSQLKALVDKLLGGVSNGYFPTGMISEKILTPVTVKQSSGKIGKYGLAHLRILSTIMGGKGEAKRIEIRQMDSTAYFVEPHGLHEIITPEEYANVEDPFDIEKDVTEQLTSLLFMAKEKGLADTLRDTAIITQTSTLSGTSQWSDYASGVSDPFQDAALAKKTVRAGCGAVVDTVIMDYDVAEVLRGHPKLVRSLGFADNRAGTLTDQELAKALGVRRVLIADVMYNSSKPGQADVLASLWGKDVIFAVAPEKATKAQKTLGYMVTLAGQAPRKVYKSDVDNPPESKKIVVKDSYDMVLVDVKCAYLFKNAIA